MVVHKKDTRKDHLGRGQERTGTRKPKEEGTDALCQVLHKDQGR